MARQSDGRFDPMTRAIRIGCASGFLGDSFDAAPQLVRSGDLDYLVFDYLAEVTMSLLAELRLKDAGAGYAKDFVRTTMRALAKDIEQRGIKVIANAGGVNPAACAAALERLLAEQGVSLKVAYITGDDLMSQRDDWDGAGIAEMFTGMPLPQKRLSMNAYLGAFPIAAALAKGADIVITGRVVDSAVTLGACVHAFGWAPEDYDRLAMGSLAGHILECGAQACGALFTDWEEVGDYGNIGYPIAECSPDGNFIVTKPEGTSGLVSRGTIGEQILYEISDPQAYFLPDVVCDFAHVKLAEVGKDRVMVSGGKGYPPTGTYKVSVTFEDGLRTGQYITIGGLQAAAKARATGEGTLRRLDRMLRERNLGPFDELSLEVVGDEESYGPHRRDLGGREAVLKVAAKHQEREALQLLLREFSALLTSGAPGTTGLVNYPPKITPVIRHFSFLIPKDQVPIVLHFDSKSLSVAIPVRGEYRAEMAVRPVPDELPSLAGGSTYVPLIELAWVRSGDKGLLSNIGVMARDATFMPFIRAAMTEAAVARWMAHRMRDGADAKVERFELPGLPALNFILPDALGGGGVSSLRNDPLGKAHGQMLLEFPVQIPISLVVKAHRRNVVS
jgi:hypothetical protein